MTDRAFDQAQIDKMFGVPAHLLEPEPWYVAFWRARDQYEAMAFESFRGWLGHGGKIVMGLDLASADGDPEAVMFIGSATEVPTLLQECAPVASETNDKVAYR